MQQERQEHSKSHVPHPQSEGKRGLVTLHTASYVCGMERSWLTINLDVPGTHIPLVRRYQVKSRC